MCLVFMIMRYICVWVDSVALTCEEVYLWEEFRNCAFPYKRQRVWIFPGWPCAVDNVEIHLLTGTEARWVELNRSRAELSRAQPKPCRAQPKPCRAEMNRNFADLSRTERRPNPGGSTAVVWCLWFSDLHYPVHYALGSVNQKIRDTTLLP